MDTKTYCISLPSPAFSLCRQHAVCGKEDKRGSAIGAAFLTKGIVFFAKKKHQEALDDYPTVNKYIARTNDQYLIYKVKYNMAQLKNYLGFLR